ncbi:MAG TPA: 8-amino-7-oxononanoate synthase, partial [Alphaproteobacteria bacterium]|nr:8-amino-7-oxononanoate synthase [Alphaproteobacteria bacterium]
MSIFAKFDDVRGAFNALTDAGRNPFGIRFDEILSPTEAVLDGRPILLFGTNNYLGLTFDQGAIDASIAAIR